MTNRSFLRPWSMFVILMVSAVMSSAALAAEVVVYKSPWCGCCQKWVEHMESAGFTLEVHELRDVDAVKNRLSVPQELRSCHTAVVEGYVLEGHVPAREVKRLLQQRPNARGLAVRGMPVGSPGMEQGSRQDPYAVELFSEGHAHREFARY